jgi:hypothetical protein
VTTTGIGSRVVTPGEVRVPISGGDWLVLKRRLNAGEEMAVFAASRRLDSLPDDPAARQIDPIRAATALVVGYLLDWSLVGPDGLPLGIRGMPGEFVEAALLSLDTDDYTEILTAVQAHDAAIRQEKKRRRSAPGSPGTWPSPESAAGGTNG